VPDHGEPPKSSRGAAFAATHAHRSNTVEHGLLINFGAPKFEIKKYVLSRIGEGGGGRPDGLIRGSLSLLASLAPFRGYFNSDF